MLRSVFIFGLGAVSGVIATVLFFTVNDLGNEGPTPGPGVGNASLVLDGTALRHLFNPGLLTAANVETAEVSVHGDGTLSLRFTAAVGAQTPRGTVKLNPEVRSEGLEVIVAGADIEGIDPEVVAAAVQEALRRRLDDLAADANYRLLTIATTGSRLTLEIEF